MSYGSVAGVQAFIRHITLDSANNPTTAQVQAFLDRRSAMLDGWIADAGYIAPVTTPAAAVTVLDQFANYGAAGDAELTQRSSGYAVNAPNNRENKFLEEFYRAQAFIASGALGALGVPAPTTALGPYAGLGYSGKTASGLPLQPLFRRTSFGNDPTAESGSAEPDY
jgi:hypothetical protein